MSELAGSSPRRAAAEVLARISSERRTLEDVLASVAAFDELKGADRGFARAMVSAALRERGRIDAALALGLDRPIETLDPPVRACLEIGAAQLWCLGTPPHAAVSATVDAAKNWPSARRAAGLLNAVLRKSSRSPDALSAIPPDRIWPAWLRDVFRAELGPDKSLALADAQTREPELHLTAKDGNADALAARLSGRAIAPGTIALSSGDVTGLDGYEAGDWWVQDAAAALPARLIEATAGRTVVDLCAAPGGKTMQLAATGADVIAVDRSAARLKRLEANLERTALTDCVTVLVERGEIWQPHRLVDAVLVDAPCSALGTLRRHPEGAWIKRPADIAGYAAVQSGLLAAGARMLKPGGTLIYCVCSPLKREGIDIVDDAIGKGLLARRPLAESDVAGFTHALRPEGDLLTLPTADFAHDAFFISRLVRTA
ncbi:MAG: RsmB/NOP family class I SAM-dependent RNA methyltransferase [Pseudomonadota bacterium]